MTSRPPQPAPVAPAFAPSQHSWYRDDLTVNRAAIRRATPRYGPDGEAGETYYQCPTCDRIARVDMCDCVGAEPDGLFCNRCNTEFLV